VRLDPHVHTRHSGSTTIFPLSRIVLESYNTPEGVYRRAKSRGMDLVAITDRDEIAGALEVADRPDVIVGSEVTGVFPDDNVRVHLGVLGVSERQHREIQRLRHDVRELLPYLRHEGVFTTLNHVASRINGRITAEHLAAIVPWVHAVEVRNGSRLPSQNRTAQCLADSCGKVGVAGSDSRTLRGIGRTWIEVPQARDRDDFMRGLHDGRVRIGGRQGHAFTMASDVLRLARAWYDDRAALASEHPLDWRRQAFMVCATLGLPLVVVPLALVVAHCIVESRFNRGLLFDLAARPPATALRAAHP
jgi:predicted metal-dependent phosphoesterase TrpH